MIQNTVELRVIAITIAKEYVKDVKSLLDEAKKIETYIQGNAIIPEVVEDPNNSWVKTFCEAYKSAMPNLTSNPEVPKSEK